MKDCDKKEKELHEAIKEIITTIEKVPPSICQPLCRPILRDYEEEERERRKQRMYEDVLGIKIKDIDAKNPKYIHYLSDEEIVEFNKIKNEIPIFEYKEDPINPIIDYDYFPENPDGTGKLIRTPILACPSCDGELENEKDDLYVCYKCGLKFIYKGE